MSSRSCCPIVSNSNHQIVDSGARLVVNLDAAALDEGKPAIYVDEMKTDLTSSIPAGAQVTVMGKFAPEPFLTMIERIRPTYFSGVPTIYALLASLPRERHR